MSKMIPLKLADMAVAACESEIQKLREENARLKAVKEQAYYTRPDGTIALVCQDDEIARLKAKVERLRRSGDTMASIIKASYALYSGHIVADWEDAKEGKQP